MSSNQYTDQKELPIPRTGIEVMNDLSLDARIVISLAYDDLLKPFIPEDATKQFFKFCMNSTYESPESRLSEWRYRKSDVEEFKLKYKDYLEEIQRDKATKLAESQKQGPPESEYLGKKGGNQIEDYRERADEQNRDAVNKQELSASDYIQQRRNDGVKDEIIAYELHDKNGNFKLTYMNIAREMGLDNEYNPQQFDAIKQYVKRFCQKGKAMIENN